MAAPVIPNSFINIIFSNTLVTNKKIRDFECSFGKFNCNKMCSKAKKYDKSEKPITIMDKLIKAFSL